MTTTVETIIAEHMGRDSWLVMWPDGKVREFETRESAEAGIRRSIKVTSEEIRVTRIEWRG